MGNIRLRVLTLENTWNLIYNNNNYMAVKKPLQIDIEKSGSDIINDVYFTIPRDRDSDFYVDEDYVTFYVNAWKSQDVKAEMELGKKPLKRFQVRMFDIPRDNPIKDGENIFFCRYSDVIDIAELNAFVKDKITEGETFFDVYKKAIVDKFYPFLKLQVDFCGEDMTVAIDC